MLRSSLQLWQSWSCAKVVMIRQLDHKDWSATKRSKKKHQPNNPNKQTSTKEPTGSDQSMKSETGETGSRSHYLVQNYKKTPALTTSSASCRKCQELLQWALYLAVRRKPAIHHSCIPSSSNEHAKPCVPIWWGPQAHHPNKKQKGLKGNYPGTPASRNNWVLDSTMQPSSSTVGQKTRWPNKFQPQVGSTTLT